MLGKMEIRTPPGSRPRDGRHCDLCGCSQPAVRCDKCGCQIFCLSCDDMYHRHPKRRFHLRKAVDPSPSVPQARPVLPVKVAHLNTANPGDPSKMPLPPPRKKKSLFGSFRKASPNPDNSPPLPKKEYSWSDRLGSIKKFMSNRPLPPLPTEDNDVESQPTTNGQSSRGDLSFIHKRSEERPPQLPQRSPKSPDFPPFNQEKENRIPSSPPHMPGQIRNGSLEPNANHMNQNREFPSNEEDQWNNMMNNQNGPQRFGTLNRQNQHRGYMPPGAPGYPGGMHQSSSATDLHNLQNAEGMPGGPQVPPHYPHYPMNPHMPPHYPYPMYPQYPNYPQYFGNSFANLSNPPTSEGDFSDHSEANTKHSSKKHPFRKRAKRSQSVMMDRMAYPGQFYPFGPYPGYGPWGAPMQMETHPSPASSVRSLNRGGRTRRRKKMTSEDDDEEFSVSSSPVSRPKSSSSDPKDAPRAQLAAQTTSSEEESEGEMDNRRNKLNTIQRRTSEPVRPTSPVIESKRISKLKKSSSKQSDSDTQDVPEIQPVQAERRASKDSITEPVEQQPAPQQPSTPSGSADTWICKHCTYINPAGNRICQVCCKTAAPRTETPVTPQSRPTSVTANSRKQSVDSDKGCSSPEKHAEEEAGKKERQDMAILNSALDEAEKQISKGLEELMKLKDDIDANMSKEKNKSTENQNQPKAENEEQKPVYKSSGRMRSSILDKLNLNKPQTSDASISTSTDTQTGQNNFTSDKIIEARRQSNSSSDAYNSPIAQSPVLERGFVGKSQKTDSSCQRQTDQDSLTDYLERKKAAEEAFLGRPVNNFGFGYGDRMDMMASPVPSMYDRFFGGGYGMGQRSHSRASLFTGRMNDFGPVDYGGFGYGPAPMYRSVSRGSLTGDYPEGRMSEFHNLRKPDFYLSMEELVERRRQENIRSQGLELVRMIREAEQQGFNADDIQVALTHCGKQNPMEWLQENWRNMLDSVVTLSTNYGNDKKENDIGLLSENEAREALRLHRGNIWAAVTECVEGRQRKYLELSARGNFSRNEIVDALTSSEGDVEMAYAKLSKSTGKPFLMRIWGAGEGAQNQDGARPLSEDINDLPQRYLKDETLNSDDLSEEIWSEDGDWDDDDEFGEERGDIEDLQTCHEDLYTSPQEMRTPESDKSDYCDAFPVDDRNASSPSDDIFFVIPEAKPEKKKGFLSKLAALRKDSKEKVDTVSNVSKDELAAGRSPPSKEDSVSQNSASSSEQTKNNGALNALKNTFSAIKDTVTGGTKTDKKLPCTQPERRTIIVTGQIEHESLSGNSKDNVKLTSIKPLESDSLIMPEPENESSERNRPRPMSETEIKETNKELNPTINKEVLKPEDGASKMLRSDQKSNDQPQLKQENALKTIESKNTNIQPETTVKKEAVIPENAELRTLKEDVRVNDQPQLDRENIPKPLESKNKVEPKKPQSLAERLKFVKQTRSGPSTSIVQKEISASDAAVKNSVDSKSNNEKLFISHDKTTNKNDEVKSLDKVEASTANQILKDTPLSTKVEQKLENKTSDVTQSSELLAPQNIVEQTKVQNENVRIVPASSVAKSPVVSPQILSNEQINKSGPSESLTSQAKSEESSSVKSVNEIKTIDTIPKSETEEVSRKEEHDKVSGNVSMKADSSTKHPVNEIKPTSTLPKTTEKTSPTQQVSDNAAENLSIKTNSGRLEKAELKNTLSTDIVEKPDENSATQQSEIMKIGIADKSNISKDISSSSVNNLAPEIESTSSNKAKSTVEVKEEEQRTATITPSGEVTSYLDSKELKVNEETVVEINADTNQETHKALEEIKKIDVEDLKIDIPRTSEIQTAIVSVNTSNSISETSINEPSGSISGNSVNTSIKENNKTEEHEMMVKENQVRSSSQNSINNVTHSKTESVAEVLSPSKNSVAYSLEKNSTEETENLDHHSTVTKEGTIVKEVKTTETLQVGNLEYVPKDKSQDNLPESQTNCSQDVSMNRVGEQESNLFTNSLDQSIPESKVEELSGVNSNAQQEANSIALEEKHFLENALELQTLSQTTVEQNSIHTVKESSTTSNGSDTVLQINSQAEAMPSTSTTSNKSDTVLQINFQAEAMPSTSSTSNESDNVLQINSEAEAVPSKEDTILIQNTEASSESSLKPADVILNQSKDTGISSVTENESSSTSSDGDMNIGKFKFSKSGKVKRSQVKGKLSIPGTSFASSFSKFSKIAAENDNKTSTKVDLGRRKSEPVSPQTPTTSALSSRKSLVISVENDTKTSTNHEAVSEKAEVASSHTTTSTASHLNKSLEIGEENDIKTSTSHETVSGKAEIASSQTTTPVSSPLNKCSEVAIETASKASTSHHDLSTKIEGSSSHLNTNVSNENMLLTEKSLNEKEMSTKPDQEVSETKSRALTNEINSTTADTNKLQSSGDEIKASGVEIASGISSESVKDATIPTESQNSIPSGDSDTASTSKDEIKIGKIQERPQISETEQRASTSNETSSNSFDKGEKTLSLDLQLQEPVVSKEFPGNKNSLINDVPSSPNTSIPGSSDVANVAAASSSEVRTVAEEEVKDSSSSVAPIQNEQHSKTQETVTTDVFSSINNKVSSSSSSVFPSKSASEMRTLREEHDISQISDSDTDSDESRPSSTSITPPNPIDTLRNRFEGLAGGTSIRGQSRPQSPFRRMSLNSRKQVIALEKKRDITEKSWYHQKILGEPAKITLPKRTIKQQLEMERRVRQMVSDRKCRTYRKAEIVVQLIDLNFEEDEAIMAANECSTLEQALSYLQQECLLCAGHFPVSQIVSMTHCDHQACRECIRAYFTVQIRDRTILDLLCPFCNEPDIGDEDVAQDYFNHLDIMLKKLVDFEIHELFQRKLRDRVLMKDPNFRWCSQCSSGFISMPNLKRLVCPDCNAVTCASCRRVWEREHQGISCEAFAALKDASDPEAQAAGLAKMLTEDGIDCPSCHFRYALAKGGCMHFRCIQCQHDFCSGCSRPFKMGQKCGVSEFCGKLGLHAHHPRNCLFYLRDKEPQDLQKLLEMNDIKYNLEPPDGMETRMCQVMEQKETADGMVDDYCGKEVQDGYAGLCRVHYVEYLGQLVNKNKVDPIQIFEIDDLELVLRRANIRLPPKRYRESDIEYREKLVNLIEEELPLDKMDGS